MSTPHYAMQARQDLVVASRLIDELNVVRAEHGPIFWGEMAFGGQGWIAVGYDEVKQIFSDPRFGVAKHATASYPRMTPAGGPTSASAGFMNMDPPQHTQHRKVLTKHMTVKRANLLRPAISDIVEGLLDDVEAAGRHSDIIDNFVLMVPMAVACQLMGLPLEERTQFAVPAVRVVNGDVSSEEEARGLMKQIDDYFDGILQKRRANPGDDLLSALVHDTDIEHVWSEDELRSVGFTLLAAGHDAPASILGGIMYWLAYDPELRDQLKHEPDLIPQALEEFLRVIPAGTGARSRIAMEDVQVGDVLVKKDQAALALIHPANYDFAVYTNPEELDVAREEASHIRFGYGPHACPGSQIARVELQIAIAAFLRRFPDFTASEPDPDWRQKMLMRGPKTLKVTW